MGGVNCSLSRFLPSTFARVFLSPPCSAHDRRLRTARSRPLFLLQKRDSLSRTKQVRDSLRIDNQRLHQNAGLLGNAMLLRDFEERYDDADELTRRLAELKAHHADLTLNLNGIRRKIEAAGGPVH
jgi:Domain of unknown function (DUF4201)